MSNTSKPNSPQREAIRRDRSTQAPGQRPLISDEIVEQRLRAQKRAAIGLDPARPTADRVAYRPGQSQPAPLLRWSAVILTVVLLGVALLLVLYLRPSWPDWPAPTQIIGAGLDTGQPVSTPGLAPGEVQLFRYEFNRPVATMAQHNEPGRWAMGFVGGVYRIRTVQAGHIAFTSLGIFNPDPFRAETEVVIAPDAPLSHAGMMDRLQGTQTYYLFQINGQGQYAVYLSTPDGLVTLQTWTSAATIRPAGETNHLAVIDDGRTIQFEINGEVAYRVDEILLPPGDLGLVGGAQDDTGGQADFDWVSVVQIPGE